MTKKQERQVQRIKYDAEHFMGHCSDSYEIKRFEVQEHEFFVSVDVEVGMKNDEGTLAACLCRDYTLVFIGKKGGLTVPHRSKKTGEQIYKPYKSFIGACLDYMNK